MFKRYKCGCIGFVLNGTEIDPAKKTIWLVKPCDGHHDDPEYAVTFNKTRSETLASKPSEKLEDVAVADILHDIGQLVADGYRFREIQRLLNC